MRLRAGLTQTDIASKVAVSRQHISNIETGITSPTVRVLQDFLQACGMNLAEFFYGPLPINQTRRQREYHSKLSYESFRVGIQIRASGRQPYGFDSHIRQHVQ